jgi:hypothetical protein
MVLKDTTGHPGWPQLRNVRFEIAVGQPIVPIAREGKKIARAGSQSLGLALPPLYPPGSDETGAPITNYAEHVDDVLYEGA